MKQVLIQVFNVPYDCRINISKCKTVIKFIVTNITVVNSTKHAKELSPITQ